MINAVPSLGMNNEQNPEEAESTMNFNYQKQSDSKNQGQKAIPLKNKKNVSLVIEPCVSKLALFIRTFEY